jgi:hypothetical protein
MRTAIPAGLALLLLSTTAPAPARFHIGTPEAASRQCISIRSIRDESAEDNDKLLFHTGGSQVYRNHLPRPCDNLRSINDLGKLRLHPKTPGRLCHGDTVEVSGSGGTFGVLDIGVSDSTRTSCKLGDFEPLTEMTLTEQLRR